MIGKMFGEFLWRTKMLHSLVYVRAKVVQDISKMGLYPSSGKHSSETMSVGGRKVPNSSNLNIALIVYTSWA